MPRQWLFMLVVLAVLDFFATLLPPARCPNDCSGHGKCVSIRTMALEESAQPVDHNNFTYGDPIVRSVLGKKPSQAGRLT